MSFFKSIVTYDSRTRRALLVFIVVTFFIQASYYYFKRNFYKLNTATTIEEKKWLSIQYQIDSLNKNKSEQRYTIYPFNPNFITDYKGYKLGLTQEQLDKLFAFRKQNKFVNSAKEFQLITGVSDSLLNKISPYFKFPDWVNNKKTTSFTNSYKKPEKTIILKDINSATQEDLIALYGIAEISATRIIKQREQLGGFVAMEQMKDIWGLSEDAISELNKHYKVIKVPTVKKIKINEASRKELFEFPYFKTKGLVNEIIIYRSMNNGIKNIEDLTKIKGFPVENVKIISLYLEF